MKKNFSVLASLLTMALAGGMLASCAGNQNKKEAAEAAEVTEAKAINPAWNTYNVGEIIFEDKAPETEGSKIYHAIIDDPKSYIEEKARIALNTLYFSPEDSIPHCNQIHYTLEDSEGISAKGGGNGFVSIFYSTRHIEKSFVNNDTTKLHYETTGVLLHELTLEPQGIGSYGTNKTNWAFIEGMADAVRVDNGYFGPNDRPKGGNYMDGYRHCGFFLVWLKNEKAKDPDFLRKFNRTALEVIPWSFDGAIKKVMGEQYNIDDLWAEYMKAMGDVQ